MTPEERMALRNRLVHDAHVIEQHRHATLDLSSARFLDGPPITDSSRRDRFLAFDRASRGQGEWEPWMEVWSSHRAAAQAFHEAREDAVRQWPNIAAVRSASREAIDRAITFLEANPMCFRSGYHKERVLRALCHVALTPEDVGRLAEVVLAVVTDPWRPHPAGEGGKDHRRPLYQRREFREYVKLVPVLDSPHLAARMKALSLDGDHHLRFRAQAVLEALGPVHQRGAAPETGS